MGIAVTKFLPLPFYPVAFTFLLLLVSLLLHLFNKRRVGVLFLFLGICVLTVSAMPYTSGLLVRSLEKQYSPQVKYPKSSAIVLLGGAEVPPVAPRIYPETSEGADRIMHTARLYHQGHAPYVISTGGPYIFRKNYTGSAAKVSADLLAELFGVPRRVILLEETSQNTRQHGPEVRKILGARNLPLEIIVVTTATHMPRAVKVFETEGFTVHPAPTDYYVDKEADLTPMSFIPTAGALKGTHDALHEYYGMAAYKLLKWID